MTAKPTSDRTQTSLIAIKIDEVSAQMRVGTAVALLIAVAGNAVGSPGVIYAVEVEDDIYYQSVILHNGHDIGAFTPFEMEITFEVIGQTALTYTFTTVAQLQADYAAGQLNDGFAHQQP